MECGDVLRVQGRPNVERTLKMCPTEWQNLHFASDTIKNHNLFELIRADILTLGEKISEK